MPSKAKKKAGSPKRRSAGKPTFDSAALVKALLAEISPRGSEVLTLRFGLDSSAKRETLELVRAYYKIGDPAVRKRIFELTKSIAKSFKDED